jgi:hypothetical protein
MRILIRNLLITVSACIALVAVLGASRVVPKKAKSIELTGSVAVVLTDGSGKNIDIPDSKVTLIDSQGVEVANGLTQLDGHFRINAPTAGKYTLCWDIQGRKTCKDGISVTAAANIGLMTSSFKDPQLFGRVLTGDNRACWIRDPFFKLDLYTKVSVTDSQGQSAAQDVRANTKGDYFFLLKAAGNYNVSTQCEKAKQSGNATVRSSTRLDLAFKNHAPRLNELAARSNGKGVVSVEAGTPIELTAVAKDIDGDSLEYLWRDYDGAVPAPASSNQIKRDAPKTPGLFNTYLLVRDGNGGYTYKRFSLEVGKAKLQFAGTVVDETTRAPIANAEVELAGTVVKTNDKGFFTIAGKPNNENRYVLNIRHNDYALWSQVFDKSFRSNVFELIRAQVTQQSINNTLIVSDINSNSWCGVTGKDGQRKSVVRRAKTTEYIDPTLVGKVRPLDADYLKKLSSDPQCRPSGAQLTLPADSLVDASGRKANGNVRVSIASLDATRRPLPGDDRAVDRNGQQADLLSYGAVYAEFRDSAGNKLNLAPGKSAQVVIPIPVSQLSTAKDKIDFWSYDEVTGKWRHEGDATLTSTANGPAYVGSTTHFSVLNMDVSGNDPAVSTCLRFELDSDIQAWSDLRMRATVSYNGNQVKTKETALNTDQYHAIYRIPFGASFPPNTLRLEIFGTFNGQSVVLIDKVINTDARPQMSAAAGLWPPYPYAECGDPVLLTPDTGVVPEYATNDLTGRPYFLTGPYGDFLPADGETIATDYYTALGVDPVTYTLGDWWDDYGFNAADGGPDTGTSYTRTSYMNHNDLGFGRDMHCANTGSNLACYVTNYGAPDQAASNADDALNQNDLRRGATVAMTYDSTAGTSGVQFYVFGNNGAAATLLKFADLDGFGPKSVPHLCLVCHGGSPTLTADKAEHSRFREFDLPSLHYPNGQTWNFGDPSVPVELDAPAFGTLNQMVHDISPTNAPIKSLINAWYGGVYTGVPSLPTPPTGWNGNPTDIAGYHDVYATTCRTCHIARDYGNAPGSQFYIFDNKAQFDGLSYVVCGLGNRVMPNAIITYKNFWTDTLRVNQFEALMSPAIPANTCQND